jgi:hypothetical protein
MSWSFVSHARANPRSAQYMLVQAKALIDHFAPDATADILVDDLARQELEKEVLARFQHIFLIKNNQSPAELDLTSDYDTLIFLYQDSIGLSWGKLERSLAKLDAEQIIVVNGRRRSFILNGVAKRKLVSHRILEKFWLLETLAIPFIFLIAFMLWMYDLTLGKILKRVTSYE